MARVLSCCSGRSRSAPEGPLPGAPEAGSVPVPLFLTASGQGPAPSGPSPPHWPLPPPFSIRSALNCVLGIFPAYLMLFQSLSLF